MIEVTREQANTLTDPRASKHFAAIKAANEGLKAIRDACKHPRYYLAWWSWGAARISPQRVCAVCRINLRGITDEERERLGPLVPKPIETNRDGPDLEFPRLAARL